MMKLFELSGMLKFDAYGGGAGYTDSIDATDVPRECVGCAFSKGLAGDNKRWGSECSEKLTYSADAYEIACLLR